MEYSGKYGYCFLLIISLIGEYARAQCPSSIPNLTSYGTGAYSFEKIGEGCLPFTISVKNRMIGVSNVRTIFDYKGGPLSPELFSRDTLYTYTKPKVYTLVQLSEANGRELIACQRVYVYDTLQPNVSLITCGANRVRVLFADRQDISYDIYWIQWGDGSLDSVSYLPKAMTHTYPQSAPHTIQVWGVNKPGYCRSQITRLDYNPSQTTQKPSIENISVLTASTGELTVRNPLSIAVQLQKRTGNGWENTGLPFSNSTHTVAIPVDSAAITCFRVQATDSCVMEEYISESVCLPLLKLESLTNTTRLEWMLENNSADTRVVLTRDGKDWRDISQLGPTGTVLDENLICGQTHCYTLVVTTPVYRATSLIRCLPTPAAACEPISAFYLPDAFTPNGDGLNDLFFARGDPASFLELAIYNAWGAVIYYTSDPQGGWDGTYNGVGVPTGTYIYRIKYKSTASQEAFMRSGTVHLIR